MKYRDILIPLLVMTLHSLETASSQSWTDFVGMGRSIAGIISFGLNEFNNNDEHILERKQDMKKEREYSEDELISTDDVFSHLTDVWDKRKRSEDVFVRTGPKELDGHVKEGVRNEGEENATEGYADVEDNRGNLFNGTVGEANGDYWMRIKSIVENMKSIFLNTYGEDSQDKLELVHMLDKMVSIGDKINMVRMVENSFDQDLLDFLKNKWTNIEKEALYSSPIIKTMLSVDAKVLLLALAKGLVNQFSSTLHLQALSHLNEQDFVIDTMRVSGFTDSDIYDVFQLLDLPTDALLSTSKTLQEEEESRSLSARSGGYGDQHKGGYGAMMKKDPLILLAGLAFATFAAYLLYRLLSSTPPVAKKRSIPNYSLPLLMSDMPEAVTNLYSWLEKTEKMYGDANQETTETEEKGYIISMNELWESFQIDRLTKSCVRRYLCHNLENNPFKAFLHGINFQMLSLLTLAELMGDEGIGKQADSHITKVMAGTKVDCRTSFPSCDEVEFNSVINKSKKRKEIFS